jgi:amino acid adenylation domain-containing protein/non-ribosomal peptide synthase protein (TIGR01720 family)
MQALSVADTFVNAVSCILGNAQATVAELNLISGRDRRRILDWNSQMPEEMNVCVHDMIEWQTKRSPSAPAVRSWDGNFTYNELDDLSTRLANHLSHLGVGPEVMVPLCFEKSAWTIVAILATMKAGGVFVPLDPDHPKSYLQDQIENLDARVMLVSTKFAKRFDEFCKVIVVSESTIKNLPLENKNTMIAADPSNAMYVLFTSGSTGKPKGVVLEHRAVASSIKNHGNGMGFSAASRVFQFSAYTFDASIFEIFNGLCWGGCVCIPSDAQRMGDIAAAMRDMEVTISFLTPTVARLVRAPYVPNLKTLILGGEAIGDDNIAEWAEKVDLISGYGPTECCMCSAYGLLSKASHNAGYIGHAVGSTSWIVDPENHERLTPVGVIGELLVLGPILARGYLKDPQKTAAAFAENPAWLPLKYLKQNRRLYKTGDLVRYNEDGTMNYIGRKDTQVKIHGRRIELGAIEYRLADQQLVEHAMVMVPKSGLCKQQLVAIISLSNTFSHASNGDELQPISQIQRQSAASRLAEIRDHLVDSIPGHMVPTIWIILQSISVTIAGKLDRAKTIKWVENMSQDTYNDIMDLESGNFLPENATETEKRLRAAWARVLDIPLAKISLNRSFFSLGGDSITAMQIVSACRADNLLISVQDVLQSKTISQLAIRTTIGANASIHKEEDFDTPFELSPIQQLYFNQIVPQGMAGATRGHHFHQSFLIRFRQGVDSEQVSRAVQLIVARHSMLRTRFHRDHSGKWTQLVPRNTESFHFQEQEVASRGELITLAQVSRSSLNIVDGPVFAATMFNAHESQQYLFLVAHHLVVDLVSWRIILQDLEEQLKSGALSFRKPLPFQTWCRLQAEHVVHKANLRTVLPIEIKPADWSYWGMEGRKNAEADSVEEIITFGTATTSALFGEANSAFRTEPSELILSALFYSFKRAFADRFLPTFFIEAHGRESWDSAIDLSGTVGWFTTISPIFVALENSHDILDVLKRTKDIRRRVPGNGWPYFASRFLTANGKDAFGDHRQMEVMFNYTGRQQQLEREDALVQLENLNEDPIGIDVGGEMLRLALFEINVTVVNNITRIGFAYNRFMHHQDRIRNWISSFKSTLDQLLVKLIEKQMEYTLSDFPLLEMTYESLKTLNGDRLQTIGLASLDEIEDIYPCSPMQQGILLSQIKVSGSYEVQQISRIVSAKARPVDIERFKGAWQQVVDYHASLRTIFIKSVSVNGGIFDQAVLKRFDVAVLHVMAKSAEEAIRVLKDQTNIRYSDNQPAHRLTICEVSPQEVFCRVEISHALMDGMSKALIMRDLTQAYEQTLIRGRGPLYSNYISYLQQQPADQALEYWTSRLRNTRPCLIPTCSRTRDQRVDYDSVKVNLDTADLWEFCERTGVTIASVFKAAWGLVLRAFTNSDEVCFGYLVSGRDIPVDGASNCVGVFINMLICRLDISPTTDVVQLALEIQEDFLRCLPFQHCSLAEIQHNLDLSGASLFNTALSIQRHVSEAGEAGRSPEISFEAICDSDPTEV